MTKMKIRMMMDY